MMPAPPASTGMTRRLSAAHGICGPENAKYLTFNKCDNFVVENLATLYIPCYILCNNAVVNLSVKLAVDCIGWGTFSKRLRKGWIRQRD